MGVVSSKIICNQCGEKITLRVIVSPAPEEHHTFCCPVCESTISVSSKAGHDTRYTGCVKDKDYSRVNKSYINLSSDFVFPKDEIRSSTFSINIHMAQKALDVLGGDKISGSVDSNAIFLYWTDVKTEWDLVDNGKFDILLKRYKSNGLVKEGGSIMECFYERLGNFLYMLNMESRLVYESLDSQLSNVLNTNRELLEPLLNYYEKSFFKRQMPYYKKSLVRFFEGYSDLQQVRFPMKLGMDLNNYVITNYNFSSVEKIYSENFEIITKTISGIGLFSKIANGSEFNEFQHTTLDSFLDSSVQNKIKGLTALNQQVLIPNNELVRNDLRNASYHGDMFLEPKEIKLICKKSNEQFEIAYLEYLKICWRQMIYISQLALHDLNVKAVANHINKISKK